MHPPHKNKIFCKFYIPPMVPSSPSKENILEVFSLITPHLTTTIYSGLYFMEGEVGFNKRA